MPKPHFLNIELGFLFLMNARAFYEHNKEIKAMNIIKGLDRIILILAIIAIVPGFMFGDSLVEDKVTIKTISPKHKHIVWEKKVINKYNELIAEYKSLSKKERNSRIKAKERLRQKTKSKERLRYKRTPFRFLDMLHDKEFYMDKLENFGIHFELGYGTADQIAQNRSLYNYISLYMEDILRREPPYFQYKNYSPPYWLHIMVGVISAFLSFLVVLFGLRGTIRLFAWIAKGFKDEEKNNEQELDQDRILNQKEDKK